LGSGEFEELPTARKPLTARQITEASRWRGRDEPIAEAVARAEAVRLAKRITALDTELAANHKTMEALERATPAVGLLDKTGIGVVTLAIVMTDWPHPGRVRDEAALAGVNPIPASSGNTVRHRLNRALHMAVITRMVHDPATRAYVERRHAEGHTNREIRRCLKCYLARQLYHSLNSAYNNQTQLDRT